MNAPQRPAQPCATAPVLSPAGQRALALLLESYEYAHDLGVAPRDFAVDLATLLATGSSPNTLRWLVGRGWVECAAEGRRRRRGEGRGFPAGTAFLLTEQGLTLARLAAGALAPGLEPCPPKIEVPVWDSLHDELRFLGRVVRRFRNAASTQRTILDALERAGWPGRLENPLLARDGRHVNHKQLLQDTVKNLNRGHLCRCLHFFGADAGRVVGWKRRH